MTKQCTAKAAQSGADLRQRAARARDAAGRFIRNAPVAGGPAAGAAAHQADADLLQLGQQLDDAIARVGPLHDEWTRLGEVTLNTERGDARAAAAEAELDAADRAEAVEAEILALADRAAEMPATTAEGLRIKLRASAHYVEEHDADYPAGRLLNSLLRDARGSAPATGIAPHPDAALFALGAQFMAAWVAEEADGDEPEYRICTRIAQQIIRTPAITVAGYGIKALLLARLDSDSSGPHKPIEVHGPPDSWWNALHQVQVGAALLAGAHDAGIPVSGSVIEGRLPCPGHDLSALSVVQLARLYPVVVRAEEVIGSAENAPCFWEAPGTMRTPGGVIINREADRLGQFTSAIAEEMRRRQPVDDDEAQERANTLLAHLIETGGVAEHPELIAEINATWGA